MNLEYLKNFLVLAGHMNFTKAAEHLFIVQSTLSRQIRKLEEDLGSSLFIRDNHSIKLTEAGALLVSEGKKLLRQIEQIELRVRKAGIDDAPSLTMVSLPITLKHFSRLYSNFHNVHPDVQFTLLYREIGEVTSLVESGSADLGLTYSLEIEDRPELSRQMESCTIGRGHLCVITSKDHIFAASGHCTIEELRDERVLYFNNPGLENVKRRNIDAKLTPIDETEDILKTRETMLLQIIAGKGVSLLPYEEAEKFSPDLAIVKIDNYVLEHDIILIWNKINDNNALRLFLNSLDGLIE